MKQYLLALTVPPLAACRYGCAGCCAAPISVFWITGIVGIVYGAFWGGPLGLEGVSWSTVLLGIALWAIATVWTVLVMRGARADKCQRPSSSLCRRILPDLDESDPMDEVRKVR
ncbi:MAG TPA: hypothetical protein VKA14_09270 [Gammaproteobacteria bacterium]|nr:hypothetical protein [Gammaproteobacteria bacterium]